MPVTVEVSTPEGPARVVVHTRGSAVGTLVLGHGAGGGLDAADLLAVTAAVSDQGWAVMLVEQPWRLAGRKVAGPARRLDLAWTAVVTTLVERGDALGPLVLGGRSAGARVACRTAAALGAVAVCCLAFPLHPPGRPQLSREEELANVPVPTLVVQGRRDAFGTPDEVMALALGGVEVVAVEGDHGLRADPGGVARAVSAWLDRTVPPAGG